MAWATSPSTCVNPSVYTHQEGKPDSSHSQTTSLLNLDNAAQTQSITLLKSPESSANNALK